MNTGLIVLVIVLLFLVGSILKRILNKSLKWVENELDQVLKEQDNRLKELNSKATVVKNADD
jgi:hypothetical protein